MLDLSLKSYAAVAVGLVLLYALYTYLTHPVVLPDLPWINEDKSQWFSRVRAQWRTTIRYKEAVEEAYNTYSKHDQPCILASSQSSVVLLPPSTMQWLLAQPDEEVSNHAAIGEGLQPQYTFRDYVVFANPIHHNVVRGDLTRQLGNLTTVVADELAACFDETWGANTTAWKEVCVFQNMMRAVSRTSNRIFVGLPLCRDEAYLKMGIAYAQDVPFSSALLRLFPESMRPLVNPVISWPNRHHSNKFQHFLEPEIQKRMDQLAQREKDTEKSATTPLPNDFLQWSINEALKSGQPAEMSMNVLAGRLIALNFAAIHTSTFTVTNLLFDLVSTPQHLNILSLLRKEVTTALTATNGVWTKQALSSLPLLDSCLRESIRLNSFLAVGLNRKITAPNGVTTPSGLHLPCGVTVAIPTYGIHNDPALYPDPSVFDPFRFTNLAARTTSDHTGYLQKANYAFVSTSAQYHPFGHGRHACPGRFFAANELKLLAAYMVLKYDVEMVGETRPQGKWYSAILVPPMKATVRVRRRREEEEDEEKVV